MIEKIPTQDFYKLIKCLQIAIHLTGKLYVEKALDESSLVRNNQDNDFNNNKLTNLDSITVNRNPGTDNELANKEYVDDSIGEGTIDIFNQTVENYLKESVGNDIYNHTNYDKTRITNTTVIKYPNSGGYLLQNWNIQCKDKNING